VKKAIFLAGIFFLSIPLAWAQQTLPQVSKPKGQITLEGTYWKLTSLGGKEVIPAKERQGPYLQLIAAGHMVVGTGGCNRLHGGYELEGDQLSIQGVATTMMACSEGMETEAHFLKILEKVKTYKVEGGQLALMDEKGAELARFKAMDPPPQG
jgi:heat shock protein HslJ